MPETTQRESRIVLWLRSLARNPKPSMIADALASVGFYFGIPLVIGICVGLPRLHFPMWHYYVAQCALVVVSSFMFGYFSKSLSKTDLQRLNERLGFNFWLVPLVIGSALRRELENHISIGPWLGVVAVFIFPVLFMLIGARIPLWLGSKLYRFKHRKEQSLPFNRRRINA